MTSTLKTRGAIGLTLIGLVALASRSTIGQDGNVQRTSGQAASRIAPAIVGCIDMNAVLKGYEKVEFLRKEMEAEAELKKAELQRLMAEYQKIGQEMEKLSPGSEDFKKHDDDLTRLRAQLEADRDKAQRDFARKEAEALATVYKEVQEMVTWVAKSNGLDYVLQISNEPITGEDPNSVVAAMMRSVVYSNNRADITNVVLQTLNSRYRQANPQAGASPAAQPTAAPAASRPAAPRPATPPAGTPGRPQ